MFEFLSSSFVSICSKFISRNQFFFTQMWDVPGIFKEKLDVVEKSWIKTEFAGEPSNLIHLQGTRFFRKLPLQIPNQFWSIFSRKHSKSYLRYSWRTSGMRVLWHQRCLHHQRRNSTTQRNTFGTQKKRYKGPNTHHRLQPLFWTWSSEGACKIRQHWRSHASLPRKIRLSR